MDYNICNYIYYMYPNEKLPWQLISLKDNHLKKDPICSFQLNHNLFFFISRGFIIQTAATNDLKEQKF